MGFGRETRSLMRKLLWGYRLYFSRGVLNSDGRRLFEEFARFLVYEHPEYKGLVSRARRDPSLENIVRVAEIVLDRGEIDEILDAVINGPYTYPSYRYW